MEPAHITHMEKIKRFFTTRNLVILAFGAVLGGVLAWKSNWFSNTTGAIAAKLPGPLTA